MTDTIIVFWKKESSLENYVYSYQLCYSTTMAVNNVYLKVIGS